ncbi:MAG: hypothetical protein EPN86_03450 [Nanoarchaeota archaeon]|nr:MAG: hypothetical protein EPN86_03450 [Nanoarchaeota archaeon]
MAFINQRMAEMGFKGFHFETEHLVDAANSMIVPAYNEFYYLVSKSIPLNTVIKSDTNIFNDVAGYLDYNYHKVQEFSGLIEIIQTTPVNLEFVRVMPYYN